MPCMGRSASKLIVSPRILWPLGFPHPRCCFPTSFSNYCCERCAKARGGARSWAACRTRLGRAACTSAVGNETQRYGRHSSTPSSPFFFKALCSFLTPKTRPLPASSLSSEVLFLLPSTPSSFFYLSPVLRLLNIYLDPYPTLTLVNY